MLRSILIKLGLADLSAQRSPIEVFVLDDDQRRHRWFKKRFKGDHIEIAETVEKAKELSKMEALQMAQTYIAQLAELLKGN